MSWEVKPQFVTAFRGKPAVVRTGQATHVFASDADGKLIEFRRKYLGASWVMYDRSAVPNAPVSVFGRDPAAVIVNGNTYVYIADLSGNLMQWARTTTGWNVTNLSAAKGGFQISGKPAVTSKNEVFARNYSGRLIQWGQVATTCIRREDCWAVWNVHPTGLTMESNPVLVEKPGHILHVYARGPSGQLIEFYKEPNPSPWILYKHA